MNKRAVFILLFLAIGFCFSQAHAQKPDNRSAIADSLALINNQTLQTEQQLQAAADLITQSRQQKLEDSLQRAALLNQVSQLEKDSKIRKQLEGQLALMQMQDSLKYAQKQQHIAELRRTTDGFAVAPAGDTLFYLFTRIGSFDVKERANFVSRRIENITGKSKWEPDSLLFVTTEAGTDLIYKGQVVLTITETDALWAEKPQAEIAQNLKERIGKHITVQKEKNSIRAIVFEVLLTLLLIAGVVLIIYLINKMFRYITDWLKSKNHHYFTGIKIKNYQLLDSDRQLNFLITVTNIVRIVVVVFSLYLALPLLFSIFPQTAGWADLLLGWILAPVGKVLMGIINYLPNLFTIAVIYLFTRYTVKLLGFLAREIQQGNLVVEGFYPDWAIPTFNVVKFLLYAFMFVIVFPYLPGSDSPVFQGVSVFLGLLFSIGSSSAIANIVAGFVITYMRPFKVGDRVQIGDIKGDVLEKTLLVTRLRTIKNEEITVPNASVLSGHTVNYTTASQDLGIILHTTITIGYDVPWKQVHELLIEAARRSDGIDLSKDPFVLQTSLDDFYVSYQLNAYTRRPHSMAVIYSALHSHIQDLFNENNVEILSPHYRAARDGNMVTTPPNYLPADYEPPSFRVKKT